MSDESKKTSHLSKLAWIVIVLGFIAAGLYVIWLSRQ